jgi:predicted transcriptional regulator
MAIKVITAIGIWIVLTAIAIGITWTFHFSSVIAAMLGVLAGIGSLIVYTLVAERFFD